jgi:hypothetical protein
VNEMSSKKQKPNEMFDAPNMNEVTGVLDILKKKTGGWALTYKSN